MTANEYMEKRAGSSSDGRKQYNSWGNDHLSFLRKQHGKHKMDSGLTLIGNAENEKGIIGNGDYLFKNKKGKKFVATMHSGKDYIKPDKGQMYL